MHALLLWCALLGPPRDLDELQAAIRAVLDEEHVPGVGIALVERDRVIWAGGVGWADVAGRRPVTADTAFRAGSITKSFVALAVMKLVEEGRIDLDAHVADLAPEIAIANPWQERHPITVAMLLEHSAGFDDMHPNEWKAPDDEVPLAEALARNPRSRVARWPPGSRFSYANPGYTVAGYLIEKVTGRRYEDIIRDRVLAPLGMTRAALQLGPDIAARLAVGYGGDGRPLPYVSIYHRPAGNLMVSPRELAALVRLFLGRGRFEGRVVVSPASIDRIERTVSLRSAGLDTDYGLGNYGDTAERFFMRGHDGGIPGFISSYRYLPGRDVGYVMLFNSSGPNVRAAGTRIRRLLVDYLLPGEPGVPPPVRPVPRDELAGWEGYYQQANPRSQLFAFLLPLQGGIRLRLDGDQLFLLPWIDRPDRVALLPVGAGTFRTASASGAMLRVGRGDDGRRTLVLPGMYLEEAPEWLGRLERRALQLALLLSLSPLLLVPFWGRLRWSAPATRPFVLPPLAALALLAIAFLFDAAARADTLGEVNAFTVGLCAASWCFALFSAGSAVELWRARHVRLGAAARLYGVAFAAAACGLTAYLAHFGIIGLRLWRY